MRLRNGRSSPERIQTWYKAPGWTDVFQKPTLESFVLIQSWDIVRGLAK